MKNYFMLAFMALALTANAQEEKKTTIEVPAWVKNVKFSGYGMLQYSKGRKARIYYHKGKYTEKSESRKLCHRYI